MDGLEDEKLRCSETSKKQYRRVELLSDNRSPQKVENASDILGQSKQEPLLSNYIEPERPSVTANFNLRKSLAWDSAFSTSKGILDSENDDIELLDPGNPANIFGPMERELLTSNPSEPEIPRTDEGFNLRQSLAWDSAFFTSEGVLDSEELFMINEGFEKAKAPLLPGLRELRRYAESSSTVDSDEFSLESLEIDLFEDIRASVQKSTSKRVDAASQTSMKTTPSSRRQTINRPGSERIAKETSVHTRAQQDRRGESSPIPLNPPRIVGRSKSISAAPTKRVPLGANCVEIETKNGKTKRGEQSVVAQKQPSLPNSCSTIPRFTPSPKSSLGSATNTKKSTVSCSTYDCSGSASSAATRKSSTNSLRRKIDSRNVNLASSVSVRKTPLRCSMKTENDDGNSGRSSSCFSSLMSGQKLSSCASSTSSFDGWSSESSLPTCNHISNDSKANLDSDPSRGVSFDIDAIKASDIESHSLNECYVGCKSHRTSVPNQNVKKCSPVNSPVSSNASGKSKPSSLRMPSPKIGFFDVEKSMSTAPNGRLQHSGEKSTLASSMTRVGKLSGVANRVRRVKLLPARTSIGTQNVKQDSHQAGSSFDSRINPSSPLRLHNVEDASKKQSGLLRTMRSHLGMTVKNHNASSSKVNRENCLKTSEVGCSSKAENKGAQAAVKDRMRKESMGSVLQRAKKTLTREDRPNCSQQNMNLQRQNYSQDNHSLPQKNEKENYFEDQIDGLSRQVSVIDISRGGGRS